MRILFLTPGFPPFNGGGERYARALALELAQRGHSLTIVTSAASSEQAFWKGTPDGGIRHETDGPLHVVRCPIAPFPGGRRGLLAWRKAMVLISLLPGDQARLLLAMSRHVPPLLHLDDALTRLPQMPDVLNAFNLSWEHGLVAGWRFCKGNRTPFVITPFAHFGEAEGARVARNATMDHQRLVLQDADALLLLTSIEREGLRRWQMPVRHAAVVGGGVQEPPPIPDSAAVLRRYGLEKPFALFVGRINYDKGAIHAARAVAQLREEGGRLSLALVGRSTSEFERFLETVHPHLKAAIRPLGALDDVEKHALLSEAAMLLLPSRADSFGIVLLEAWLHGTPVIGARAGGIPGVIDDQENGLLVPYGDVPALTAAIRRLLNDDPLRRRLGQCGQEKVRRSYTWEQVCDAVLDVYSRVRSLHRLTETG